MTFLVTAWRSTHVGPIHNQHLLTVTAVNRLTDAIVTQTQCDYITIRIIRQEPTETFQLGLPTCTPST